MVPPNHGGNVFDLGSNPMGIFLTPTGTPVGVGHFSITIQDFKVDAVAAFLKQRSTASGPGGNGLGTQFRDPDGILVELVPSDYRNPNAVPNESRQAVQPLFRSLGLNHVTLQVSDVVRATGFYESLFGPSSGRSMDETIPNIRLGKGMLAWGTSGVNRVGVDHFCVAVEEYEADAVTEKLKQNGIPSQRLYRPDQVFVRDPDGILIQLAGPGSA